MTFAMYIALGLITGAFGTYVFLNRRLAETQALLDKLLHVLENIEK